MLARNNISRVGERIKTFVLEAKPDLIGTISQQAPCIGFHVDIGTFSYLKYQNNYDIYGFLKKLYLQ